MFSTLLLSYHRLCRGGQNGPRVVEVPAPSVYSLYCETSTVTGGAAGSSGIAGPTVAVAGAGEAVVSPAVNHRASWLVGSAPVLGDAVVSLVRCQRMKMHNTRVVVRTPGFSVSQLLDVLNSGSNDVALQVLLHAG